MFDIVALGEYLIDFTPSGKGDMGNPAYEMNPGGAVVNCLAACCALGGTGAILGAVGDDLFGRFLMKKLMTSGIDGGGVQVIPHIPTTLAFVSLADNGEREFAFVRNPGADTQISVDALDFAKIDACRDFHFGSLSLSHEPARTATRAAVSYAKSKGKQISYDPNYRAMLWPDRGEAIEMLKSGLPFADVVKMSEEEMELLLDVPASDAAQGTRKLLDMGISEAYITYGSKGAYYADRQRQGFVASFPVKAVDTTGCGDAFMGTALFMRLYHPDMDIAERTRFANAAGALCATKRGGIMAMPSMEQLQAFLQ